MNQKYTELLQELEALISPEKSLTEILSETCILLKNEVFHYDWVGFYLLDHHEEHLLRLGPYCGKATEHTIIPVGKGVCGQVARNMKLKIVQDVTLEGNYIACSMDVQSEIVVPVIVNGKFVAEIDIDSHSPAPFTIEDEQFLSELCEKLAQCCF
jgi:L-methionine (R)-S-oxide reductase